ncbi:MAG: aspartate carbamoyltransferase [Nanoarchaeota archaeon]|nr:aspartate carbamoyltransferase [Nanoarchaeota archaeon]MCG2718978.1 aspartate carbamoyltransferase [Nanoarchaeota archaeon]
MVSESKNKLKHVIEAKQFSKRDILQEVFDRAEYMEKKDMEFDLPQSLKRKRIASFFYEESTRTRFSFEVAALSLGGLVVSTEKASQFSSVAKGETLDDTIRILSSYVHAIVMRHNVKGSAKRAAQFSSVPIINSGDGEGEHPTQALLDIYTINKEIGRMDDFSIAMVGDLKYGRTVHSLSYLLESHKNVKQYFVSPEELQLPEKHISSLIASGVYFEETTDIEEILDKVDVLYVTRIQKERFKNNKEFEKVKDIYKIDKQSMKKINDDAIVMHPLPRVTEIDSKVDTDPRAAYFRQARNGLYVRMALLDMILG